MKFKHALIITPFQSDDFGAGVMNQRNIHLINKLSEKTDIYNIYLPEEVSFVQRFTKYLTRSLGYVAGLTKSDIKRIIEILNNKTDVDVVWINSSLFGLLAKKIKKKYPSITIGVFYHNAEYMYAKAYYKSNRSFKNQLQIQNHKYAEKMSLKHSDFRIVLSKRDDIDLKSLAKTKNHIIPMSIEDKGKIEYKTNKTAILRLLFVGSAFFANLDGIRWFVKSILLYVNAELTIVGRGMGTLKPEFESLENVFVHDKVDDLTGFYASADIVINPVHSGSGMKTKTAEALMYGMPILGTQEAFVGYDYLDIEKIGRKCNTDIEFIEAINYFDKNRELLQNLALNARAFFEDYYSIQASLNLLIKNIN